jgi:transposase-like protein
MYSVAFGVMDSETNENWSWFMEKLRAAIGTPPSLVICTDAGQAAMGGVKEAFPIVEHRKCMFHLVNNFKKRWHGKIFDDNMWPAAYAWNSYAFNKHWLAIVAAKPDAMAWVRKNHNKIWSRNQFNTLMKVDYVSNNLAESFNNWMKGHKGLNLDDLMDVIR